MARASKAWPAPPQPGSRPPTAPPSRSRLPPPPPARSALCIAAIACLSKQESARTGNALGLIGVTGGVVATLGGMQADAGTYAQVGPRGAEYDR